MLPTSVAYHMKRTELVLPRVQIMSLESSVKIEMCDAVVLGGQGLRSC